jgi:L-ascorbate metabolism protein UlaG (beta-lactamase superfamily)
MTLATKHTRVVRLVLILALLFSMLLPSQVYGNTEPMQQPGVLQDIAGSYAQQEITELVKAGVISGYADGTFRPTQLMTRAELSKIISLSAGLKENRKAAEGFVDVPADSWYAGYVGALYEAGIVQGTSQTQFSPEVQVTREQLVVFFIRAMGLEKAAADYTVEPKLTDFRQVSDWAKPHVAFAYQLGFIGGMENDNGTVRFAPQEKAERQALARLAYEFMSNGEEYAAKAAELVPSEPKPTSTPTPSPAPTVGGPGGGSSSGGYSDDDSRDPDINRAGDVLTDYTITGGSKQTVGPVSGTVTVTGTLTVNPGPEGEVTLRNINAANLAVLSGSSNSIVLNGVSVTGTLRVNAASQTDTVRIEAGAGTNIAKTDIESKVILEGKEGELGSIEAKESAAGQTVELRGKIDQKITVAFGANGIVIKIADGAEIKGIVAQSDIVLEGDVSGVDIVADEGVNIDTSRLSEDTKNTLITAAIAKAVAKASSIPEYNGITIEHRTVIEEAWGLMNAALGLGATEDQLNAEGNVINKVRQAYGKLQDLIAFHAAYDSLVIGFQEGDSASSVTRDVYLPTSSLHGGKITWYSENMYLVSDTGKVSRPRVDHNVRLIALVQKGSINGTKEFTLRVVGLGNHAPVAKTVADKTLTLESNSYLSLTAGDLATDEDGDTLTVQSAVYGTEGIVYLSAGRDLYISPRAVGSTTVTATVYDGIASVDVSFTVTVTETAPVNRAPVALALPPSQPIPIDLDPENLFIEVDVLAEDPDGDSLFFTSATTSPAGIMGLEIVDNRVRETLLAPGKTTMSFTIEDEHGASIEISVEVTVVPSATTGLVLEYLGHSSFILTSDEQKVLIDPWRPRAFELPDYSLTYEDEIDLITVSHNHFDHNYTDAAPTAKGNKQLIEGVVEDRSSPFPWEWTSSFHSLSNEAYGDIQISTVNVPHFPEVMNIEEPNAAFIYEVAGMRIVHMGDGMKPILDGFPDEQMVSSLQGEHGIDVLMIPIGDYDGRAMENDKILSAIEALDPKVVIPMHPWSHKQQFLDAADNKGFIIVDQQGPIGFSANQLPNDHTVIWNMVARSDSNVQPPELTVTARHDTSIELGFTLPDLPEDTVVEIQQSKDGGAHWSKAQTTEELSAASGSATVAELSESTDYLFRLALIQGSYMNTSNIVNNAPPEEQILSNLVAKLGFHHGRMTVKSTSNISRSSDLYHYTRLEMLVGTTPEYATVVKSVDITGDIPSGSTVIEGVDLQYVFGNQIWYRLVDSNGHETALREDGRLTSAPPNDGMMNGEFVVLGHEGVVKIINDNSLGNWNSVNGYQAVVRKNGGADNEFALNENANTIINIPGGVAADDEVQVAFIDLNGNTSAYATVVVKAGPTDSYTNDFDFRLLPDTGSIQIKNTYGASISVIISKNGVAQDMIAVNEVDPIIPVQGQLNAGDVIRVAIKSGANTSVYSAPVTVN